MRLEQLKAAVEKNIRTLFKAFHQNPAIFLSEADLKCYLYSLLTNDPSLREVMPKFKYKWLRKESQTVLVHSELRAGEKKIMDMAILKPVKTVDYTDFFTSIGIEIKFNRKEPARKGEKSSILNDIKKLKDESFGYLLWLNWDRMMRKDQLNKAEKRVKKYRNVKFFYIDVFSKPVRTNVPL